MEKTTTQSDETTPGETEIETVSSSSNEPVPHDVPEELLDLDEDEDTEETAGSGLVSGAFGLTALAFAVTSLTGGWIGNIYGNRAQYNTELHAKAATSQAQSTQNSLDAFGSGWHAQAAVSGIFALAALLFGAGVLASPGLLLSGRTPAWARGAALGAVIIGAVGLLLAVLTWFGLLAPVLKSP